MRRCRRSTTVTEEEGQVAAVHVLKDKTGWLALKISTKKPVKIIKSWGGERGIETRQESSKETEQAGKKKKGETKQVDILLRFETERRLKDD